MQTDPRDPVAGGRRAALKAIAAGSVILARSTFAAPATTADDGLLRRRIPSSGEPIAAVGLGTYDSFDVADASQSALETVLTGFVALGGQLVDSSPMYGRAESVLGELAAKRGLRDRLFLATKVWTRGRAEGIGQMARSLDRLQAKRLDLMQIHNLLDWRLHLPTLREWQQQGRIRYLGVTHYHASAYPELESLLRRERPDFVQFNYSMAEREAEQRLLPLAQELGIAVIINRPFAKASLFSRVRGKPLPEWAADFDCASWAQFFLKFILAQPAVTCTIPATSKLQHLQDNLAAGRGRLPDAQQRSTMIEYLARI
ncbi:MAG: aldo/keto reductase [Candidatus Accumulibacter sp. UW26]|jgi:aryl-alcohol dehydrogenase-like predicted oxidoreductase